MKDILIVSATRMTQPEFESSSQLGLSLRQLAFDPRVSTSIVFNNDGKNARGLGAIYNDFLTPAYARHIVVHDDVYIHDTLVRYRLNEAIARFDVIGLAGNKNPDFRQPSWALKFNEDGIYAGWQDMVNLSGAVAHTEDGGAISFFGEMPAECELLDGLFLAVNTEKVLQTNVEFDPQFRFHFYDLDFCRACRQKGLSLRLPERRADSQCCDVASQDHADKGGESAGNKPKLLWLLHVGRDYSATQFSNCRYQAITLTTPLLA